MEKESVVKYLILMTIVLTISSFFLRWTDYNDYNLFQGAQILTFILIFLLIGIALITVKYPLTGSVGLFSISSIFIILSLMFSRYFEVSKRIIINASFSRFIIRFIGIRYRLDKIGYLLFRFGSIILLVLAFLMIFILLIKLKKQNEQISKKIGLIILSFILIIILFFGLFWINYQIVKTKSNNLSLEFFECTKKHLTNSPYIPTSNMTLFGSMPECVEIIKKGEDLYPDVFWQVSPLICSAGNIMENSSLYIECTEYVLVNLENGVIVSSEDIREKFPYSNQ